MKAGIAPYGRTLLAAVTAAALVMSVMFLLADTSARADHVPPDDTYTSSPGDGSNRGPFWDTYFGLAAGSCVKIDDGDDDAFEMPAPDSGEAWYALVVKQGSGDPDNFIYLSPVEGHSYPSTGPQGPGYSHVIVCSVPETTTTTNAEETTTTTTSEETTTTVTEETTTTVTEETTTTAAGEETTTTAAAAEETTTTLGPTDEVEASIVVTVAGTCELNGNTGQGVITVGVSVDDGAVVEVRDRDGDVVGTFSSDGSVTVPEGATYTWEATPNEGFEFPAGSPVSGTIVIETCSNAGTLPFTGADNGTLAILATAIAGAGALVLLLGRSMEEDV